MARTPAGLRLRAAARAFGATWRNPDLRRAQLGFAGAWTAEWAFTVGLGVYAFEQGGPRAVGLVSLLRMLPAAVVTPVLTPYADRWRRERVLVLVSTVRGLATAGAAALVATGGPSVGVYALAVVVAVVAVLYRPVHSALLPSLCRSPHDLTGANVVRGMVDSTATLVGPAVAAVLLWASGVAAVFVFAAAACLWSAAVTARLHPEKSERAARPEQVGAVARLAAGARAVAAGRDLRLLIGLTTAQTFTRGALGVLSVVVAIDLLHTGEPGVGALGAALGAGAVVGSVASSLLVGTRRLAAWFGTGVALWGLPLVALGLHPSRPSALVLLAVVGVGNALVDVGVFTLVARLAPDEVLARVFGVMESLIALSVGVGAVVTGFAVDLAGLRPTLVVVGLVAPVLVAAGWHRLRRLDGEMVRRDSEIALLQRVPLLTPLPLPAVEQLARGLQRVTVPTGATVFAQGDVGDRFYVIVDGVAEVVGDGEVVATLGPGDGFGEVALLRRVTRTATVRARSELALESLTDERFVAVLTGIPSGARRADAHVDALLERFAPRPDGDAPTQP